MASLHAQIRQMTGSTADERIAKIKARKDPSFPID
jgi:hypothetical protein